MHDLLGGPVLHYAVVSSNAQLARMFLDAGADHSFQGNQAWTALYRSTYHQNDNIMRMLLVAGADPCTENEDEEILPGFAFKANLREAVRLLCTRTQP
jgi:ankyrin repeat protein